jgi:hypothetical protein
MMEDKRHLHMKRKEETGATSLGKQVSSPHNTHSQHKEPMDERESSANKNEGHHNHRSPQSKTTVTSSMVSPLVNYNVNVQFDPAIPQAGKPTRLSLVVTEQKVGEPIKQFDIIHDKLMHLIIVNKEDLSHFAHIHPNLDRETGIFHIMHTFAKAGKYKMWIDVKPKDGMQQILTAFAFIVEGQPIHLPAKIAHEQTRLKNVHAQGQSYQIALNCEPEHLVVGRDIKMTFEIKDANGKPITNLEPLMAAGGHCVIIDAHGREFLHVHPAEVHDGVNWRGGPSVLFLANFPKAGLYRAWGQFQHEGRLLTADFTFEVVAR